METANKLAPWKEVETEKFGRTLWWVSNPLTGVFALNVIYVMQDDGEEPVTHSEMIRDLSGYEGMQDGIDKLEQVTPETATNLIQFLFED